MVKTGRPGNTYHMNDVWWTWGGCWWGEGVHIQIMYYTSSWSATTIARTPDIFEIDSTGLHWYETCSIVYCTRVCSWTPPQHPPDIIHMIDVPSPFLYFTSLPLPCTHMYVLYRHKPKGGGLGMRPVTNIEPLNLLTNVKAKIFWFLSIFWGRENMYCIS